MNINIYIYISSRFAFRHHMPSLQVQLDAKSQPHVRLIANPPLAALLLGMEKQVAKCLAKPLGFKEHSY